MLAGGVSTDTMIGTLKDGEICYEKMFKQTGNVHWWRLTVSRNNCNMNLPLDDITINKQPIMEVVPLVDTDNTLVAYHWSRF